MIELWGTPMAAERSFTPREVDHGVQLANQVERWTTPKAISGGPNSKRKERGAGGPDLQEQAAGWAGEIDPERSTWPTPSVMLTGERTSPEAFEARRTRLKAKHGNRTGNGAGADLAMVAKTWPTPATRDFKGANSSDHVETNGTGRAHMDQLPNFVEHAFLPLFRAPEIPDGQASSSGGRTSSPPSPKRKLNPFFVEALMCWPIGLSGFERVGTGLSPWLQQMRGCLSLLCSRGSRMPGVDS